MTGPVTAFCMPGKHLADHPTGTTSEGAGLPEGWTLATASYHTPTQTWHRNPESAARILTCPDHALPWPDGTIEGHGLDRTWVHWRSGGNLGDWQCQCGTQGTGYRDGHAKHAEAFTCRLCARCDHFVAENPAYEDDPRRIAPFIHLDNGEKEHTHDAQPSYAAAHSLEAWRRLRPDLFTDHGDGIGPNSPHHHHLEGPR